MKILRLKFIPNYRGNMVQISSANKIGNRVNWFRGAKPALVCLFTERCIDSPEQVPPGQPTSPPRIAVQPRPRPRPCWPLTTNRKPLQARSTSPFQLDPYCRPFLQQIVCHEIRRKSFESNEYFKLHLCDMPFSKI